MKGKHCAGIGRGVGRNKKQTKMGKMKNSCQQIAINIVLSSAHNVHTHKECTIAPIKKNRSRITSGVRHWRLRIPGEIYQLCLCDGSK